MRDRFFELLAEIHRSLTERGIPLRLAATPSSVQVTLARAGFERECCPVIANEPVAQAVARLGLESPQA